MNVQNVSQVTGSQKVKAPDRAPWRTYDWKFDTWKSSCLHFEHRIPFIPFNWQNSMGEKWCGMHFDCSLHAWSGWEESLHGHLLTFKFVEKFRLLCYNHCRIVCLIFIFGHTIRSCSQRQQPIRHRTRIAFAVSIEDGDRHQNDRYEQLRRR